MNNLITYLLAKNYTDKVGAELAREGFKVQVEQDRSILETTGQEKILYLLPKNIAKPKDGYDEYIYANNNWEQVGVTDIDLSGYATTEELNAIKPTYKPFPSSWSTAASGTIK